MRGYLKMWRTNLAVLVAFLLLGVGIVLLFHYRIEHKNTCVSKYCLLQPHR
ncbi:MAG TPA: hypothetical protein VGH79_01840 [Gaiellaceae bacterium]|jgi:predicted negative regulator of RcsB-dependent stress response